MFNLLTVIFVISTVVVIISLTAHLLPSRNLNYEKASPYECGFDPLNSARIPFSFRFFLVAILFLLFDLEVALLFPFPYFSTLADPVVSSFISIIFLFILIVGLIFEWVQGGLDWAE
uniref:NADH-ubiquinone oxidoreductase chain 3 n=1 Tax=Luidia quinaria TaxID=60585 RepID=Q5KSS5_9ECHI|nr:NADH dehydrogenase subunit 3 [Luidia quinaria]BAD86678.1 NADH dehydrogenase subunit 3 [Luidia quinaria]